MEALADIPISPEIATMLYGAGGLLTRMSVMMFMLPGIGDFTVSTRIRLVITVVLTAVLFPMVVPQSLDVIRQMDIVQLVVFEGVVGFALGFLFRVVVYALQVAGTIIAQTISLSQIFGSGIDVEPNPTIASLLMVGGTALFVTLDFHTYSVGVLYDSYGIFPLGDVPATDALAGWATERSAATIQLAVSLSLPFLLIGFLYNAVIGLINQAMPQMMVTFIGVPANVMAGIILLGISISTILLVWADRMSGALTGFW